MEKNLNSNKHAVIGRTRTLEKTLETVVVFCSLNSVQEQFNVVITDLYFFFFVSFSVYSWRRLLFIVTLYVIDELTAWQHFFVTNRIRSDFVFKGTVHPKIKQNKTHFSHTFPVVLFINVNCFGVSLQVDNVGLLLNKVELDGLWCSNCQILTEIMTQLLKITHTTCCEQFHVGNYFLSLSLVLKEVYIDSSTRE